MSSSIGGSQAAVVPKKKLLLFNVVGEGKRVILSNKKLGFDLSLNLVDVALEVINKHTKVSSNCPIIDRNIIDKVSCESTDITECLDFSLTEIDSPTSRIFGQAVKIVIKAARPTPAAPRENAFSKMMKNVSSSNFLPHENVTFPFLVHAKTDTDADEIDSNEESDNEDLFERIHANNVQEQIKILLRSLFYQIGLGYTDASEEVELSTFINSYTNVLCFVEKHWESILMNSFPKLPGPSASSMSLQLLTMTERK
mmetsp:Transcript_32957/g.71320  ORF Transcript_32957/g.71320 Transcript_32957/m.71320 type:complete len:255 (-) Transcript_32957:1056-1820(-)